MSDQDQAQATGCSASKELAEELRGNRGAVPIVMVLLGAAYGRGCPDSPVRSFGIECYGKGMTVGDDTWNALTTTRKNVQGRSELGIVLQHNKGRWTAEGGKLKEYWISFDALENAFVDIAGAVALS